MTEKCLKVWIDPGPNCLVTPRGKRDRKNPFVSPGFFVSPGRNKTVLAEGVVCMREGEHVRALFVTEGINTLTQ